MSVGRKWVRLRPLPWLRCIINRIYLSQRLSLPGRPCCLLGGWCLISFSIIIISRIFPNSNQKIKVLRLVLLVSLHLTEAGYYSLISQMTTSKQPLKALFPSCSLGYPTRMNNTQSKKLMYHVNAPLLLKKYKYILKKSVKQVRNILSSYFLVY